MNLESSYNCHGLYNLQYHLILVTKYRKQCINKEIFDFLVEETNHLFGRVGAKLIEINYEPDHVHILMSVPPQVQRSKLINTYKTVTARLIRVKFSEHLAQYYWKPYFWSRSYLILSSGRAPIEVIKRYIRDQKGDAANTI